MTLRERLEDFAGALTSATNGPDEYPMPEYVNLTSNMADLRELWAEIKPQLRRDLDKVQFIDQKLAEIYARFAAGDRAGRKAVMAIYNLSVETLR